jgi:hypothetical protein
MVAGFEMSKSEPGVRCPLSVATDRNEEREGEPQVARSCRRGGWLAYRGRHGDSPTATRQVSSGRVVPLSQVNTVGSRTSRDASLHEATA